MLLSLLAFAPSCFCHKKLGSYLYPQFYDYSCPQAQEIVKTILANAVAKEPRIAASLLRLHFHDCFVKVCYVILSLLSQPYDINYIGYRCSKSRPH
jgi:peroxidase